ncbi:DUF427 domain-containing protein [Nocardia terpenica]|uniref:DUF427 domain-containing protein n=1 Tax=Nocardia terpenica TaxID=455432 RepID=A0A161WPM2_9NOCA|nr:DUF427 domain-containing protein [Nocardia terpenica]KZM75135.1 hypothetical protein AWN90_21615 [Nocardia terpenica]NQE93730.1 DUF427 domain-containing protein [Nocardia terpenica]
MMRAIWNETVIAESPRTVRVEGNDYFPPESLHRQYFADSPSRSLCPWKGLASYYNVIVNGEVHPDAAWYYPKPSPLARKIKNHVAFWGEVQVEGTQERATTEATAIESTDDQRPSWLARLTGRGAPR